MHKAVSIDPSALYDGGTLYLAAGITPATLARARRCGQLRFTRQGKRILYLGQWILDWLETDSRQEVADAK